MALEQAAAARDIYDARASVYDDSWHTRFARHMVELARVRPGEQVLDLACGTGLASFVASEAIGPTGKVIGVDISNGMLEQARSKQAQHKPDNISFFCHSITDLETLNAVRDVKFDLITCASALVLLEDPAAALKNWSSYLKPGGRLIVDVTHPQNQTPGVLFEKVSIDIGHPLPWHRLKFQTSEDLSSMMETAGFSDVEMTFMAQLQFPGTEKLDNYKSDLAKPRISKEYLVEDWEAVFEQYISWNALKTLASPPELKEKAREAFKAEWRNNAVNGKLADVDGVFVGLGWKRG